MGALVVSGQVQAAPAEVFDIIVRPASWQRWFSVHREFLVPPPERLHEGSRLVTTVAILGLDSEFEWTVEALDAPYRIVLLGSGRAGQRSEFTYWLRPSDTGTFLTIGGVFTGPHLTTDRSSALEVHGREQLRHTLRRLAREATSAA